MSQLEHQDLRLVNYDLVAMQTIDPFSAVKYEFQFQLSCSSPR